MIATAIQSMDISLQNDVRYKSNSVGIINYNSIIYYNSIIVSDSRDGHNCDLSVYLATHHIGYNAWTPLNAINKLSL